MKAWLIDAPKGQAAANPAGAALLAALEESLKQHGHAVLRHADWEEALARFALDPADLVLLAFGADRLGGLDWCRRLRRLPAAAWCVLLVVAADLDRKGIQEAIHAGADDYLLPSDDAEVVAIRLALAEHR